ncbi:polyamine aminopropyltransferase [Kitasatospora sp. CM 4170]|uniref:Polyamine aminopropyltransferase n=1 Tax=Kitasatospora aburaviensis TaxID=67265 RepID=A0ABW1EZW7_9ACTN|nr:polyamine aminopropyltransferase [Kitasatospora sp. CM 4170]WNM46761.1 polyamine aminopropyltransferase [Kitasatospora sp. CM 4170]
MINHPAGPPAQGLELDDGNPPRLGRSLTPLPARRPSRLRAHPRLARLTVLLAAFVCAACGLVYELELVALGSYLLGDSVTQTSVVLSVMVFAMGLGSLLAKRFTCRPATAFALVECALALTGGLSVLALYSCWAWIGRYQAAMVGLTCLIGVLIGAEIPLLMTLIQRIRREDAGRAAADLFAADYVGALIGGLAFPFLILPAFGPGTGALVTGAVNAVAGAAVVLWLFREEPPPRVRLLLWGCCALVLALLAATAAWSGAIERSARSALYGAQVRVATHSRYQEIVLTGPAEGPLRLYRDGRLAVCGPDEYRGSEALVHPAMAAGPDARVLLLGGGDGLALREVLRHGGVHSVLVVDADPALTRLARTDPGLAALSGRSLDDPRVRVAEADPLEWLRSVRPSDRTFDVVLADLPVPADSGTVKFHSQEFYGLATRLLSPGGRLAVRAGGEREELWQVESGLRAAGLRTIPYAVAGSATASCPPGPAENAAGRTAADAVAETVAETEPGQSFLLASAAQPPLGLAPDAPPPRAFTADGLRASAARLTVLRPARPPAALTLLGPR